MKLILRSLLLFAFAASGSVAETIPLMIPYSGSVNVNSAPFNGKGLFRFAIINGHADCAATTPGTNCATYWSNDGTSANGSASKDPLTLPVTSGQFSVKLGDISLMNTSASTPVSMPAIPVSVFSNSTLYLRVWFDDGIAGMQRLAPDRQLISVPYAYRAEVANSVVASVIGTAQIAPNAVTSTQILNEAVTTEKIKLDAVGSAQISNGSIIGADIDPNAILNIGGLSVDSGTLSVDAVNNRIGIGTNTPTAKLEVGGNPDQAIRTAYLDISANNMATADRPHIRGLADHLVLAPASNRTSGADSNTMYLAYPGNLAVGDTVSTRLQETLYITPTGSGGNGNVGIGTTGLNNKLDVAGQIGVGSRTSGTTTTANYGNALILSGGTGMTVGYDSDNTARSQ